MKQKQYVLKLNEKLKLNDKKTIIFPKRPTKHSTFSFTKVSYRIREQNSKKDLFKFGFIYE